MVKENFSAVEKKELLLNTLDREIFDLCVTTLNSYFKSTELQEMVNMLRRWLSDKKVVNVAADGTRTSCVHVAQYFVMKRHCKEDVLNFMATFLGDAYNCSLMLNTFPPVVLEEMEACLQRFYVPVEEVMEKEGWNQIFTKRTERWGGDRYELVSPWFTLRCKSVGGRNHTYLSLSFGLYAYLYRAFHRQRVVTYEKELPADQQLTVRLTEESAVGVFPMVVNLYERGEIDLGSKGKMKVTALKKCVQQLGNFEEFFPETPESALKNFRAGMLFAYLHYRLNRKFLRSSQKNVALEKVLRDDSKDTLLPFPRLTLSLLLPHLTGLSASLDTSNCYVLVNDIWMVLIDHAFSDSGWFSLEDIIEGILERGQGFSHLHLFSSSEYCYSPVEIKNGKTDKEVVTLDRFRKEIAEPYVKALFLMMAAAGLFDIAYRDYREEDTSWVDGLRYVRITNLGKYVWGFSKEYKSCFAEKKIEYLDVDPDRLIVRSLVENNPYDCFLCEVARPIGNRRYVFTKESFIKKCRTKEEVEGKMNFFVKFIAPKLSAVWQNFFDSILENCKPFKALRAMEYFMYQVDEENKVLIHLLNSDSLLRKMVIRAEGFIFLVKEADRRAFADRLKCFGYIL